MADTLLEPYLFFGGQCREALDFYTSALGAKVEFIMTYREGPQPAPPGFEDQIMHASLRLGDQRIMASDSCEDGVSFQGFALSLKLPTEADARHVFDALADRGTVRMPLGRTFWSPCFGMVTDRYGVGWMITLA